MSISKKADIILPSKEIQELATSQALRLEKKERKKERIIIYIHSFNKEGFGMIEFAYLKRLLEKKEGVEYKS